MEALVEKLCNRFSGDTGNNSFNFLLLSLKNIMV